MKLFGRRQVIDEHARAEIARLDLVVDKLRSALTLLQTEQDTVHTEVRKWMRRAENAERRMNATAPAVESDEPAEIQVGAPTRRKLWGARARIAARRAAARLPATMNGSGDDAEAEETDGSDS